MFDNPQNNMNTTSKKIRPVKMSDEEFELFYKEIYAEFGPKGVPAFDRNAQVVEPVEEPVAEPVVEAVVESAAEVAEEPMVEEVPQEAPAATVYYPEEEIQENTAKAAAVIRNVKSDEVIDDYTDDVKIVKKEKGVAGLIVLLSLECLAIAAVVGYWLVHIL